VQYDLLSHHLRQKAKKNWEEDKNFFWRSFDEFRSNYDYEKKLKIDFNVTEYTWDAELFASFFNEYTWDAKPFGSFIASFTAKSSL